VVKALMQIDATLSRSIGAAGGVGNITSASLNGKSFTFGTSTAPGVSTMAELTNQKNILMKWWQFYEQGVWSSPNRAVAVFPSKVSHGFPHC
jgi:hypothetical protein